MRYFILYSDSNDEDISDVVFYDELDSTKSIYNPSISKKENTADVFSFEIDKNHFMWDKIEPLSSYFKVFENAITESNCIFYGRVVSYEKVWNNHIKYTAEGALAFLKDNYSIVTNQEIDNETAVRNILFGKLGMFPRYQRSIAYNGENETYEQWGEFDNINKSFRKISNIYVDDERLTPTNAQYLFEEYVGGHATAADFGFDGSTEAKAFNSYELMQKVAELTGLHIEAELDSSASTLPDYVKGKTAEGNVDNSQGSWSLHYYSDYHSNHDANIEFGENLLDFTTTLSQVDRFTAVMPIGKDGLNIGGNTISTYIVTRPEQIEEYGYILKVIEYPEIEDVEDLRNAALKDIFFQQTGLSINCKFVDLSRLGFDNVSKIRLNDNIRCISRVHNVDEELPVTELTIDLFDVSNSTVQLGKTYSVPITEQIK